VRLQRKYSCSVLYVFGSVVCQFRFLKYVVVVAQLALLICRVVRDCYLPQHIVVSSSKLAVTAQIDYNRWAQMEGNAVCALLHFCCISYIVGGHL